MLLYAGFERVNSHHTHWLGCNASREARPSLEILMCACAVAARHRLSDTGLLINSLICNRTPVPWDGTVEGWGSGCD